MKVVLRLQGCADMREDSQWWYYPVFQRGQSPARADHKRDVSAGRALDPKIMRAYADLEARFAEEDERMKK